MIAIEAHEGDVVFFPHGWIEESDEVEFHHIAPWSGGIEAIGKFVGGGCHFWCLSCSFWLGNNM